MKTNRKTKKPIVVLTKMEANIVEKALKKFQNGKMTPIELIEFVINEERTLISKEIKHSRSLVLPMPIKISYNEETEGWRLTDRYKVEHFFYKTDSEGNKGKNDYLFYDGFCAPIKK